MHNRCENLLSNPSKYFHCFIVSMKHLSLFRLASGPYPGMIGCPEVVLFFFFWFLGVGLRLSPLGTSVTNWPIVPAPGNRWWVWSSRWHENGRGNRSTRRNPAPLPLCPPHELTRVRTRAAAMGSRRLTAWTMSRRLSRSKSRPFILSSLLFYTLSSLMRLLTGTRTMLWNSAKAPVKSSLRLIAVLNISTRIPDYSLTIDGNLLPVS
jgi:hypothetical protein